MSYKQFSQKSRLRFMHIPKTAGLTFRQILLRQYPRRKYFSFTGKIPSDIQRYRKLSEQEKQEIGLFLGHAPLSTGIEDVDKATIITLLRHPINRVKSLCQYVSEGNWKDYLPEPFELDRFLNSGDNQLTNHQTKFLINSGSDGSPYLIKHMSPTEASDRALENLCKVVSRFGLQEYFDESLIHFSQFLGWDMPFYYSVNRKNPKHLIEFKQRHLDQIAELNAVDIELYARARKIFLEKIAGKDYNAKRLKWFKSLNRWVTPLIKIKLRIRS